MHSQCCVDPVSLQAKATTLCTTAYYKPENLDAGSG